MISKLSSTKETFPPSPCYWSV